MDRCEQEQRQSEYDKAYYNVPPKHMLPFFFFNDLSSSSNSLSSFLSTPFDEIQDPGSILKKFNKKIHTQPHNPTSPYALCLTSLQNQEKKVFQKKRETTKKKV